MSLLDDINLPVKGKLSFGSEILKGTSEKIRCHGTINMLSEEKLKKL